jgi:hypothetical protein
MPQLIYVDDSEEGHTPTERADEWNALFSNGPICGSEIDLRTRGLKFACTRAPDDHGTHVAHWTDGVVACVWKND